MRKHPKFSAGAAGASASPQPAPAGALTAAVQPLLAHLAGGSPVETGRVARAWELYEMPEVRFPARQYSNAFASAKLVLGRRVVVGKDPVPVLEPASREEEAAWRLLESFAGGAEGQVEFLDRMGTYFVVPGDMVAVGSYDPSRMAESKFAKWDLWSTSEVRWDGTRVHIQTDTKQDHFQEMPEYIRHIRIWNKHPRRGWEPDSPVLSSMGVLELVNLYDDRLAAEALSRLTGAGIWPIPQGMKLPTATGDPAGGTPQDFLRLLMEVAEIAIRDRRSAAAMVPIMVEAAAEDIEAMKDSFVSFSTPFDERIGELQEKAIRRWATAVDLPAEVLLGLAQATHWNSSLISEDKVQSFIVPSLRRAVGNLTHGWLRPALAEHGLRDPGLVLWFDPAGIKTRVDLGDEAQWAKDRFMVSEGDTLYATGLNQASRPEGEDLKRQLLLHMARQKPEFVPDVLRELGVEVGFDAQPAQAGGRGGAAATDAPPPAGDGRPGPQPGQDDPPAGPGRTTNLSTSTRGT